MASNLTVQVRYIAEVTTAVARGDLSRKITVDVKSEILELKNTIEGKQSLGEGSAPIGDDRYVATRARTHDRDCRGIRGRPYDDPHGRQPA
jgi:hypothetical protein